MRCISKLQLGLKLKLNGKVYYNEVLLTLVMDFGLLWKERRSYEVTCLMANNSSLLTTRRTHFTIYYYKVFCNKITHSFRISVTFSLNVFVEACKTGWERLVKFPPNTHAILESNYPAKSMSLSGQ